MFSLQQLFGKTDKFFDLLEASAEQAQSSVQALSKIVSSPQPPVTLEDFVMFRRKEKRIHQEISEALVNTFITGLEREDIETLSLALYKIPKAAEKFAEVYLIGSHLLNGVEFTKQIAILIQATDTVSKMVKQLRELHALDKVKEQNDRLQYIEGEADKLMLDLLKTLYSGTYDPLKTLLVKDLYELLEKIIDRCRDAGNVVTHIVLRNT